MPFANVADLLLIVARIGDGEDATTVFAVPAYAPGLRQTPNVEMDHTAKTSTLSSTQSSSPQTP